MKKNYLFLLLLLMGFNLLLNAQTIQVERIDLSTNWSKVLANGQIVGFPAFVSSNASLNFTIRNTGGGTLTYPLPTITGANPADFTITTPPSLSLGSLATTNFEITYNPADSLISNALLTIASNAGTFTINLKGPGKIFYGPLYPPLPAYTYTYSTSGSIGQSSGVFFNFSNVNQSIKQKLYWGPQMLNAGFLWMRASTDGNSFASNEHFTFSPGESNLAGGIAVWRATSFISTNFCGSYTTYLKCVLTTTDFSNNVFALTDPTTLGLSEEVGGLAYIPDASTTLKANFVIYASPNANGPFTPFIDYYNNPGGGCNTMGAGTGNDVASGFYWKDIAPVLTINNPLNVSNGLSGTISTGNLNVSDDEDLAAPFTLHPELVVFSFNSNPSVFGIGQVKKNGVTMNSASTFTLQDVQNNLITYLHDGSNTTHDEFQFSIKDSKGVLAKNGPFTYNINIGVFGNVIPVVRDTMFFVNIGASITRNLVAVDPDGPSITFSIVTPPNPAKGNITGFNSATGQYTYNAVSGSPTIDAFTYQASDGFAVSAIKTVTINQVNNTTMLVKRSDAFTTWSKDLVNGQAVAFPAGAANPSLQFTIVNTGASNLFPTLSISGANASDFTVTTSPTSPITPSGTSNFTITYNPADSLLSNAVLTITGNSATYTINLTGSGKLLYGSLFPPLPAYPYTYTFSGNIGRAGGATHQFSNIVLATKQKTYWGHDISTTGTLWMRNSLDGGFPYAANETFTWSPGESNLANGVSIWRATSIINTTGGNVLVYLKFVMTATTDGSTIFPLTAPTTIGLSEEAGGLAYFPNASTTLHSNNVIMASTDNVNFSPYLDFYDAYPLKTCGSCAYVDVSYGFYWKDVAPKLSTNNGLTLNEGATATLTAGTPFGSLNVTDDEDLAAPFTAHPELIVFNFNSNPSVFNIGQVKKSGVPMTSSSTFTLQDLQNNIITYTHDGSETTLDQFQFSVKDSKGVIARDGAFTNFNFNIIIIPQNDPPVANDTSFTTSYVVPITKNLLATDPDGPSLTYSIVTGPNPAKGNITGFNSATGQFTYNPVFGAPTTDAFTFQATDGSLFSAIKTVTINLTNMAPVVSNSSISTMEDVLVSGTLTATDPEGASPITFQLITNGAKGVASIAANGNYSYQPNLTKMGADYFTFKAQDPSGALSIEDTVFVRIIPRLDPGDIIVVDKTILRLYDPATNQDTIITKNQGMSGAINLAYKTGTSIFVFDGSNGLIKANPATGAQSMVSARGNFSSGGPIGGAPGMVIDANGKIVVADWTSGVVRVDSTTGVVTPLFNGGSLGIATGVVYLNNGDLLVSDASIFSGGSSKIIRITLAGVQTVVGIGGFITLPLDIALIDQDTVVVTDAGSFGGGTDRIYKININTGVQTLITTGGNIAIPTGLDYQGGKLFVVNGQGGKKILDVNPNSGTQTIVTGSTLINPWGLMVVPFCDSPQFTICPGNQGANTSGSCSAVVNYSPAVTGNPTPNVTYSFAGVTPGSGSGNGSGSTFNKGTTTVTLTATNACGSQSCSFDVVVTDVTPPTITCPAAITVNANNTGCTYLGAIGTATALDNCTTVNVTGPFPAGPYSLGTTTVTWTATDAAGLTATCTQTVTVVPSSILITSMKSDAAISGAVGTAGVTTIPNNCTLLWSPGGQTTNYITNQTPGTYTVTATDANGCTKTKAVTVN